MALKMYIVDETYRMKVINFLKIYGYYDGILANNDVHKKYVRGELKLDDIIQTKKEFKKIKMSVRVTVDYFNDNYFDDNVKFMNHFYKVECLNIRKKYGNFFDKI